jgi:hypothetical protein
MDKRLGELDNSAWTEEEKAPYQDALANLGETIALLLNPESPTPLRSKDKSRMLA